MENKHSGTKKIILIIIKDDFSEIFVCVRKKVLH
jgi:hypothetical protein